MPRPTSLDAHVDAILTQISIAFRQDPNDFVADQVFPSIPVAKQGNKYFIYTKDNWMRTAAKVRPPSTESAGSGFDLTTDVYFADVLAVHKDIDDQIRANADDPFDPDKSATMFVSEQLMLKRDIDFATAYFQAGVWGSEGAPAGGLWDTGPSDPIVDVTTQKRIIKNRTGKKANVFLVSGAVHDSLVNNSAIIDRISGGATTGTPALITKKDLARVFEVDKYLVAEGVQNTANEGQTFVGAEIFGKDALLVHAATNPGLLIPSGGYIFNWSGLLGSQRSGMRIANFRMDELKSDRVEGEMAYDMKLVASELGHFFTGVVS